MREKDYENAPKVEHVLAGNFRVTRILHGALRMPDLYTRMHAASVTDSIAPILITGGILLQSGLTLASLKLIAILVFLLLTGPTAANALASAALLAGKSSDQATPTQEESSS